MVEADSQLKLLPASTLGIYKVLEYNDMLSMVVFDTIPIPILDVWPVSVSYRHSVVGISVSITDYVFLPS